MSLKKGGRKSNPICIILIFRIHNIDMYVCFVPGRLNEAVSEIDDQRGKLPFPSFFYRERESRRDVRLVLSLASDVASFGNYISFHTLW